MSLHLMLDIFQAIQSMPVDGPNTDGERTNCNHSLLHAINILLGVLSSCYYTNRFCNMKFRYNELYLGKTDSICRKSDKQSFPRACATLLACAYVTVDVTLLLPTRLNYFATYFGNVFKMKGKCLSTLIPYVTHSKNNAVISTMSSN